MTHSRSLSQRMGSLLPNQSEFHPPLAAKKLLAPTGPPSPAHIDATKERREQEIRLLRLDKVRAEKEKGYLERRPQHAVLNNEQCDYSGVKCTSSYQSMLSRKQVVPSSFYTGNPKQLTLNEAEALLAKQREEWNEWKKNPYRKAQPADGDNHVHYFYNNKGELVQRKWNNILSNEKRDYSGIKGTGAYKSMAAKVAGMHKPYL